mmetsp:Transcript_6451/g.17331  ORF Transcript_6451/g.17331 Transcript_6451/m.17331 type:complete len:179 (+) Transcript_6451:2010-2546(+)
MLSTTPINIGAGAVYGVVLGTFVTLLGHVAGAWICYVWSRWWARDWISRKMRSSETLTALNHALAKGGAGIVMLRKAHHPDRLPSPSPSLRPTQGGRRGCDRRGRHRAHQRGGLQPNRAGAHPGRRRAPPHRGRGRPRRVRGGGERGPSLRRVRRADRRRRERQTRGARSAATGGVNR